MKEDLWELKQPTQKVVEYLDGVTVDGKNIEFVSDVQAKLVSENLVEVTIKFFAKDYKLVTGYLNHENKYGFIGIDKKEEGKQMNNLVIMKDQQAVTTSLQVAEVFGKNHKHVLDAIQNKIDSAENSAQYDSMFAQGEYKDKSGKRNKMYYMNRDGFTFIAFGFTGKKADEFKLKYIEAFNKMEETIKAERIQLPKTPMEALKLMFDATEETNNKVNRIGSDVKYLKDNQRLDVGEYGYISRRVSEKVNEYIKIHGLVLTAAQRSKLFKDINRGLNEVTGIKTRSQLRQRDFDKADEYISNWQPSTATVQIIKEMSKVPAGQTTLGE